MSQLKLTKTLVGDLQPTDSDYVAWDAALPGFGVRVKTSGAKSYIVQYRNRQTGSSRRKTLGREGPLLTLHQARNRARVVLADAIRGDDPVARDKAQRLAPTIKDLAGDYLRYHAVPKKRPASVSGDRSMLDRIILPRWSSRKVTAVSHRDIQRLHASMSETPYLANRALALISRMFTLSLAWGWRGDNPAKGIERFAEARRERWLKDDELLRLLAVLDAHANRRAAEAVRLQILTGARIGEILSARWQDFDLARGVWTRLSHHTKQKRLHHLPLSEAARQLLTRLRSKAPPGEPFVFPGDAAGKPLQDIKRFWHSVTLKAGLDDYRLHDNRHTHASHLVSGGLSLEIVGRLLGHTSPLTTRRYAHLADDPVRAGTETFGAKVRALESAK